MKVKELIKELEKLNPEMDVILQKDAEGNGFSLLSGVDDQCIYVEETGWWGEVYDLSWSADNAGMEPEDWEAFKKKHTQVVVLYPL